MIDSISQANIFFKLFNNNKLTPIASTRNVRLANRSDHDRRRKHIMAVERLRLPIIHVLQKVVALFLERVNVHYLGFVEHEGHTKFSNLIVVH